MQKNTVCNYGICLLDLFNVYSFVYSDTGKWSGCSTMIYQNYY